MGFVYCTGKYYTGADFDPGPGVYTLPSVGGFLLKLDPGGNFIWARNIGWQAGAGKVFLDASLNIHLTGSFYGTSDFDPGPAIFNMTSAGGNDLFISKLDANGDFLWAKRMGSTLDDYSAGLCVDKSGNVLTTGYFAGTVDFDPDAGVYNMTTIWNTKDVFISKLDINGNFVWAKGMGNNNDQYSSDICTNNANEIFSIGTNSSACDFDPGPGVYKIPGMGGGGDIYISKLDSSGSLLYAKAIGSSFIDAGRSIGLDPQGSIIFAGHFSGNMDCDPGIGVYTLVHSEYYFLSKWNICSESNTVTLNFCDSTVYNGVTFSTVCDSTFVTTSPGGCDSITFVHVPVVHHATADTIDYISCNDYTLNGQTYTSSGTYNQQYVNAAGCDSILTFNFTRNTINTNVSQSAFTLTAQESGATYQWMSCFPYQLFPGEVNQFFNAPGYGEYAVILTMYQPDLCADTSACITLYPVGISEKDKSGIVYLFPNPCTTFINARFALPVENATLQIVNMTGQVLQTSEDISGKEITLNTSGLTKGIYFLKVYDNNHQFLSKFIVE